MTTFSSLPTPPHTKKWLGLGLVLILSLCALTWLYSKANAISPSLHESYTKALRDVREADVAIDSEILANRLDVTRNYDRLMFFITQAKTAIAYTLAAPVFIQTEQRGYIESQARALKKLLEKKMQLADLFKRKNAVLRNSLAYFSPHADEFLNATDLPAALHHAGEQYARQLLSFARNPDEERTLQLNRARENLLQTNAKYQQNSIKNMLLHGDTIRQYLPEVDNLTHSLKALNTSSEYDLLSNAYLLAYRDSEVRAGFYQKLLYLLAIALTAYLAFTFIRLQRTQKSLAQAHYEVSRRYAAQLQAENQLRLHAAAFANSHDGMVISDSQGNILDVNPAFTRITGYERNDVLGTNPRIVKSGRHDPEFYRTMWKSVHETGNWQGEIWNRNKYGEIYPELLSISAIRNSHGELTNFVGVFSNISRLKEQEKQLTQMAYYDALTELPNRVLLADRLSQGISQTLRTDSMLAVCYLDLDGFKPVNDIYGHAMGDRVLVEMSRRLKDSVRGGDTVARLGGDEFVVLLLGLNSSFEYEMVIQRILEAVNEPVQFPDTPALLLSASMGVRLFSKLEADLDPDTLMRHADQAMYQAKQSGKNRYRVFDAVQDRHIRTRHDHIERISQAIENNEFSLYYQPKVNMRSGKIIGAEALIRWQHPERGLLAPNEFLPLIEGNDLMVKLGEWVIATALVQLDAWHKQDIHLSVSVNVSSEHLQHAEFLPYLSDQLAQYEKIASLLELEILENSALEDIVKVSTVIEQCKALGISFALDDFGTGYSSLTYLKRLAANTIKIDQSFVRDLTTDPDNLIIIQGIMGLASAFQRHVIVEGVESVEQGKLLLQFHCDNAQGFIVARPMQAAEIPSWINTWKPYPEWQAIQNLFWHPADQPLLTAKIQLRNWVSVLIHAVKHHYPIPPKCIQDTLTCDFGTWYHTRGMSQYQHLSEFNQIALPHRRVHAIAHEIRYAWDSGDIARANALIPELIAERDIILHVLDQLELKVAYT